MTALERITGRLTYPMLVVTAASGGERSGCLVGFSTQCSINPVRFLVCLSERNHTYRVATGATHIALHLLTDAQHDVAALFGEQTGDEVDKFSRIRWRDGTGGVPILEDAPAWVVGRVLDRRPLGDHVGFLVEPVDASCRDGDWDYLDFAAVRDMAPGHEA